MPFPSRTREQAVETHDADGSIETRGFAVTPEAAEIDREPLPAESSAEGNGRAELSARAEEIARASVRQRRIPRASYRLQFHKGFTFRDAERLVPYLAALGISDLY